MKTSLKVALVLLLVGCGGGTGGPTDPGTNNNPPGNNNNNNNNNNNPPPPPSFANVSFITRTVDDGYGYTTSVNQFSPADVTIAKGGTVTWTNSTGVMHNITFGAVSGAPANVDDNMTGSFTRTFATAGTFSYACTNHSGMTGVVHVQ